MSQKIRGVAVAIMVVGAMSMIAPQLAFSSAQADRTSNIQVATDSNALLGIENKNSGFQLKSGDPPQRVATLRNNLPNSMTIDNVVVDSISTGSNDVLQVASYPTSLASGNAGDVTVECNQAQNLGTSTVTFRVTQAYTSDATIRDVTFSVTIDIKCQAGGGGGGGGGFSSVFAENISTGSGSQTLTFTPSNTKINQGETVTIDLSDAGDVNYTDAQVVSGPNANQKHGTASVSGNTITFTADRNIQPGTQVEISASYTTSTTGNYTAVFERSSTSTSDNFTVG